MAVSIILLQTRSLVTNYYKVANSITTSSGIVAEVFVKKISTEEYDRVATPDDILNLGVDTDTNAGYYRVSDFYKLFEDASEAQIFADGIKDRLSVLMTQYDELVNDFVGSESTEIDS